jgi:Ser/Thr protein kinase RdoA (MazF antagonist)
LSIHLHCLLGKKNATECIRTAWSPFLEGYRSVRPLKENAEAIIPALRFMRMTWTLQFALLRGVWWKTPEVLEARLQKLGAVNVYEPDPS